MVSPSLPSKQNKRNTTRGLWKKYQGFLILIIISGVVIVGIKQQSSNEAASVSSTTKVAQVSTTGDDDDDDDNEFKADKTAAEIVSAAHSTSTATATESSSSSSSAAAASSWDPKVNPLGIPPGKAQNLPSIRIKDTQLLRKRRKYGGAGDKQHLGGFSEIDHGGISPSLFKHMITSYGVHSFLDIGCGRGFSTSWFALHGCDVICAEGSHDAIERTVLPDPVEQHIEHDFSRGPWWPEKTYDVAWAVEFLEHVNVQFHYNYVAAFRKAALIFVTSSVGDGWHHVEVHNKPWWIRKYEAYGFRFSEELTNEAKEIAKNGRHNYHSPDGKPYDGFYIWSQLKVFINPVVAALPEHAHLFPEFGCYGKRSEGKRIQRECDEKLGETPLDPSFYPVNLTDAMDQTWNHWIATHVDQYNKFGNVTKEE